MELKLRDFLKTIVSCDSGEMASSATGGEFGTNIDQRFMDMDLTYTPGPARFTVTLYFSPKVYI